MDATQHWRSGLDAAPIAIPLAAAVVRFKGAATFVPFLTFILPLPAIFGFNRLAWALEEAIGGAIDALLAAGVIGDGGLVLTLRGRER